MPFLRALQEAAAEDPAEAGRWRVGGWVGGWMDDWRASLRFQAMHGWMGRALYTLIRPSTGQNHPPTYRLPNPSG